MLAPPICGRMVRNAKGTRVGERGTMAQAKQPSKRKLPVLGAAGISLAVTGGASASTAPTVPSQNTVFQPVITLSEEEISDVSLATFYVFDKENARPSQPGVQAAQWGCRGWWACRACRGCGCRACRACRGCGGCGCGCR